jgi:lipoprotein-anchoring transpeptidase ErfK/SrfK
MRLIRIFILGVVALFGLIGFKAYQKKQAQKLALALIPAHAQAREEIQQPPQTVAPVKHDAQKAIQMAKKKQDGDQNETIDRVWQLFTTVAKDRLPIVETITYSSRVPWIKGRQAWIADYASHFMTSRHFIARSLNGKPDYFTQNVSAGDRFNVLRTDKNINFYLLVDISLLKMWFYYLDLDQNEKVLLKTYAIGAGRLDEKGNSITPTGKYVLGDKIAIYKPGNVGYFQNQPVEMIQIFGTRWLPFKEEIGDCAKPAKGYGIHGAPCALDMESKELKEDMQSIGRYDSDGCVRLSKQDVEELFSIVITRPTIVEIVKESYDLRQEKNDSLKVIQHQTQE